MYHTQHDCHQHRRQRHAPYAPLTPLTSHTQQLGALVLLLILLCTACSAPGAAQPKTTTHEPIASGPVVYTALGASDAAGVGTTQPDNQGYVALIDHHLPRGSHYVNLGISGIHLHEAIQKELPIAIATNPRLVTIWLVANDFVARVPYASYMNDLTTLLQRLHTQTQASIYIANLPDLTLLPAISNGIARGGLAKTEIEKEIKQWNAQIAVIAKKYDATLVDLYQANSQLTAHPEYISSDGFHPSAAGYTQLAGYFWTAIQKDN